MIVHRLHTGGVLRVQFSPDGSLLGTSGGDGFCCVWKGSPIQCVARNHSQVPTSQIDFSHDSRYFAYSAFDPVVVDLAFGGETVPLENSGSANGIAFHPFQSRFFAHRMLDQGLMSWNLPSGSVAGTIAMPAELEPRSLYPSRGCQFSPDGAYLLTCHELSTEMEPAIRGLPYSLSCMMARDSESGEVLVQLGSHERVRFPSPSSVRFSPDGTMIAAAHFARVRIWDVESEKRLAVFEGGGKHVRDLCFSGDGAKLLTVSYDKTVRVWDTTNWQQIGAYDWQIGKLTCIDIAPDGLRYAAGGSSGKVVVWDAE